jgi:hypothetical protein
MAAPSEWTGLNVFATCAGSASTTTFCALTELTAHDKAKINPETICFLIPKNMLPPHLSNRALRGPVVNRFKSGKIRKQHTPRKVAKMKMTLPSITTLTLLPQPCYRHMFALRRASGPVGSKLFPLSVQHLGT